MKVVLEKYDSVFQRIFEIIPGLFIWILLLSPLWGGLSIPLIISNTLVVLTVYWLYRAVLLAVGLVFGYRIYSKEKNVDWLEECNKLNREDLPDQHTLPKNRLLPKQLVVIANYGEPYEVLKRSIQFLVNQNYPRELIYLAVSIEERKAIKDEDYAKRGEYLKRDFGDFFEDRLFFFVHPSNIEGEVIGAAANRTWGTKSSVEVLEKRGEDVSEFLITAPDGDIAFEKNYFAAAAYKWLTVQNRNQRFYQTALYTFNNNYWDVPILVRILSTALTLPILASSVMEKHKRETYSCYSVNLKVMKDVNYWDTSLGIDDTTFYWRPYLHFNGDWSCEVFYVPLAADAIYNPNYFQNHIDQYKQYLRWGWGVISFPIAMKVLLANSKIPFFDKLSKTIHLLEVFVLHKVLVFLLTFGMPVILLLNDDLSDKVISHSIPDLISTIMTLAIVLLIPTTIYKVLLIPPRPKNMSIIKFWFLVILELPMNIIVLLTFSSIPFIEATTRMMIGQQHAKTITWSNKQMASKKG